VARSWFDAGYCSLRIWYYKGKYDKDDHQRSNHDPEKTARPSRLKPGSIVDFELSQDGRVFLKTDQKAPENRFARLRGSAKLGMPTDELMALTRGENTD
jgi:antitoxin PrlF